MTLDTRDHTDHHPSVGVDAVSLEYYSAVETDDLELIVYDEREEDAWIQSDSWADAALMA
ncbi:hypothetical protein ACFOZ7_21375 [Natribaculum luteum]|uniref:Halobacterial output domain-containing protein n=1 Tax=Natribaculum luteum TaxID=1586232 RepID=A0ABD5P5N1_9EURY|nr:hypothetical protein [Natribaculum luteum]